MLKAIHSSNGYLIVHFTMDRGKYSRTMVQKFVAKTFIPQLSKKHQFFIHLDYNRENNMVKSLRWPTKEEMDKHFHTGLNFKPTKGKSGFLKLSEKQVIRLKK